ncbi:AAA family ATPase [Bradyrhizobium sp. PUT101]|uniref:AAA family ATPase n=1 Tax=Bradyrhizobium sp. PUT101 TaxID=3447427 RepID=UPI003F878C95
MEKYHPDAVDSSSNPFLRYAAQVEEIKANALEDAVAEPSVAVAFIRAMFADTTEAPIYICTLPNDRHDRKEPVERSARTNVGSRIRSFIDKWDRPGRALYFCTGIVERDAKREKANIVQTVGLHADIDFKDIDDTRADVERKLSTRLRYPPSILVFSGGGVHAYWLFKEALDTQANIERIESALRQLADVVGGDLQVCEVSRLMRLPGTHNTKHGAWTEVQVINETGARYELDDLEEWLSEQSPIILRKSREPAKTAGQDNVYLQYAREHAYKPLIDVEQRLTNMMYMGGGENSIHTTQISVTASLLNRGVPIDDVVAIVMGATRAAAGEYGKHWNWKREERAVRKMSETWIKKHPEVEQQPPLAQEAEQEYPPVKVPVEIIMATPYKWVDPKTMPRRDWLYGRRLIRRYPTATIAAGGTGKTSLLIAETLAMVSGQPLLDQRPSDRLRVWLWNLEDPREEIIRRVQAGADLYGLNADDIGDRLFLDVGREKPLIVARMLPRTGVAIIRPIVDALIAEIKRREIDVLIIDPFVSCHQVTENDNNAIDSVVKQWGRVAEEGNCAVELVHHVRKGEQEVTVESARGGGSFGDACRMVRVVNRMTKQEAQAAGIKDSQRAYFRTYIDKNNLAPPAEASDWFKIESIDLGNGPNGPVGGDSVGVVTTWNYPKPLDGMTGADFERVAAAIRSGQWRRDSQAASWVGYAVAKALELDLLNEAAKAKVKGLLKVWLGTGSLVVVRRQDPQRKAKDYVEVADDA